MEAELQCSNGIQSMERKLRIACHASDANIDNVLKHMCYLIVAMRATVVEHEVYIASSMFSLSRLQYSLIMRDLRDVKQGVEKSKLLKLDEGFLLTIMLENFDTAAAISLLEITELDVYKTSAADMQGSTTRADGES
ncbi:unnamed protein product [Prunus armeniaca]|uniref:Uncharacterized protein n=1 Tax=Prunus armeniaca TaxID=36596 RepID=A0A6J5UHT1_PRUAR|nr:unnamed protein product [Prunus armeniaca]